MSTHNAAMVQGTSPMGHASRTIKYLFLKKKKKKTVSNYKQVIKRKNQGKLMRGRVADKCDGHGYS